MGRSYGNEMDICSEGDPVQEGSGRFYKRCVRNGSPVVKGVFYGKVLWS